MDYFPVQAGEMIWSFLFNIVPGVIRIVVYAFTAVALTTIATHRGIRRPWMAWIPVARDWQIGSLSDQYRYLVRGEIRSKRKWLLGLSIATAVLTLAEVIVVFHGVWVAMYTIVMDSAFDVLELIRPDLLWGMGILVPLCVVFITYSVVYYMALYDIYTSCDPRKNVLFLVLSIFFSALTPVFLMLVRDKEQGMPPRRQPEYRHQPNYPPQPGYPVQPNYPPQQGYSAQPNYPPQQGYSAQPNYPPQQGYPAQPNYPPRQGYPVQPNDLPQQRCPGASSQQNCQETPEAPDVPQANEDALHSDE